MPQHRLAYFFVESNMTCGIYILYFECDDGQYYIGQSINIEHRYKVHCSRIIHNKHINTNLNNGYIKYGIPTMSILEVCTSDKASMDEKEIYWINAYNSFKDGMNKTIGGGTIGFGQDNPTSVYTDTLYIEVFLYIVEHPEKIYKQIADTFKVSTSLVKEIALGTSHSWLRTLYPTEYTDLLSRKNHRMSTSKSAATLGIVYPKIFSPEGQEYSVTNLSSFAREHNLQASTLCRLFQGKYKQHKGWTI